MNFYICSNDKEIKPGPKGKIPWIEFNGEIISDSQAMALFRFCYDEGDFWLCKEAPFSRDPFTVYMIKRRVRQYTYSHGIGRHSKEEVKPILVEDMNALSTFLGMNTRKYLLCLKRPCIMLILTSYVLLLYVGCTTAQHVKKFLPGDTVSEVDCAVFGLLSNMLWHSFGNSIETLMKELPNLCDYCQRIKTTFWPDWDDCITHGSTTVPTK
ncbi:LOW QUALITY PROTEIN: hypothetical protein KUTeg_019520 [Tegillarca granosa]|uniref:Metaxin glutathione S-transferase domain-containing protein n=1 Tax=Tegillarca granosa TaxID=220873 RepID=A0ABQ9ECS0_TEGGR|nr:LOW QUALITY PROTEIN: hypothetical protein KUTeg_019520 [Tegillarca granosa]